MTKNKQKLNKIIAIFAITVLAYFNSFSVAQAAIFGWFSDEDSGVSASRTFGIVTSYLNPNSQLPDTDQENTESLPIVQNNSLISANPITAEAQKKTEERNLNQGISVKKTAEQIKELVVHATAYSSTPDQTDSTPFITALGTTVRDGIIAANFLPFGAKIKIPELYGDKIFVVEDRMNRRFWHRIDIWFPDRQSALEFGFKKIKIQILDS